MGGPLADTGVGEANTEKASIAEMDSVKIIRTILFIFLPYLSLLLVCNSWVGEKGSTILSSETTKRAFVADFTIEAPTSY